jgi:hypothetical protein
MGLAPCGRHRTGDEIGEWRNDPQSSNRRYVAGGADRELQDHLPPPTTIAGNAGRIPV